MSFLCVSPSPPEHPPSRLIATFYKSMAESYGCDTSDATRYEILLN